MGAGPRSGSWGRGRALGQTSHPPTLEAIVCQIEHPQGPTLSVTATGAQPPPGRGPPLPSCWAELGVPGRLGGQKWEGGPGGKAEGTQLPGTCAALSFLLNPASPFLRFQVLPPLQTLGPRPLLPSPCCGGAMASTGAAGYSSLPPSCAQGDSPQPRAPPSLLCPLPGHLVPLPVAASQEVPPDHGTSLVLSTDSKRQARPCTRCCAQNAGNVQA